MLQNLDRQVFHKISGIYLIFNKTYFYVGSTSCLYRRINEHICGLKKNNHPNPFLQKVFNKHSDSLRIKVIETCPKSSLEAREIYYLNIYKESKLQQLNIQTPYRGWEGCKLTEQHKKNIQEAWINALPKHRHVLLENLEKARLAYNIKRQQGWKPVSPNKGKKTPLVVREKQSLSAKKRGSVRQYMTKEQIETLNNKISLVNQGSLNYFAKLNDKRVIEIKKLLSEGVNGKDIANKFSISRAIISQIKTGKIWKNIQLDN